MSAATFSGVTGAPLNYPFLVVLGWHNLSPSKQGAKKPAVAFPKKDPDSYPQPVDTLTWSCYILHFCVWPEARSLGSSRRPKSGAEPVGVRMSCPPSPDPLVVRTPGASPQFRNPASGAAGPALGAWFPVRLSYLVAEPELRARAPLSLFGCLDLGRSGD